MQTIKISLVREGTPGKRVLCPQEFVDFSREEFGDPAAEHFYAFYLDSQNRPIGYTLVSKGGLNAAVVTPREAIAPALLCNAHGMIFMHNHPSGDPSPSEDDIRLTSRFQEGARLLGLEVLDHIVVGSENWTSLRESGHLN